MRTSELTGAALDWAVAKAEGISLGPRGSIVYYHEGEPAMWHPSTNWAQGGPIIERERLAVSYQDPLIGWACFSGEHISEDGVLYKTYYGPTPLIAAMRCFVTSELGEEVEVPEALMTL